MTIVAKATIPIQSEIETSPGQRAKRRARVAWIGDKPISLSGDHEVTLTELPEGHDSDMAYEVRITHPGLREAPEVFRYLSEKDARAHFELFVTTLARQNLHEPGALLAPTVAGRIAD